VVTLHTIMLNTKNFTFCSHIFVWISEQTAIISLHSINWPVFTAQMECVYCMVRAESLNAVQINLGLKRIRNIDPWRNAF
jgi:hypothetical protein